MAAAALVPPPLEGFAGVASWIAADVDGETLVFRRLGSLAARNLLYLQAEMLALEGRLARLDAAVAAPGADMVVKDAARTWEVLVEQCEGGDEADMDDREREARLRAREHMEVILALREKIRDYREFA